MASIEGIDGSDVVSVEIMKYAVVCTSGTAAATSAANFLCLEQLSISLMLYLKGQHH